MSQKFLAADDHAHAEQMLTLHTSILHLKLIYCKCTSLHIYLNTWQV